MPVPFLKKYGHKLIDNGYEVLAISPGGKFPTYDYSSKTLPKITHKRVNNWLANGHARDGVGIRSRFTPMVDIDCRWKPLVLATVEEAEDKIGYAPRRIGAAPKVGLIYRTTVPFEKVQSKAFTDPKGRKAQLEILGDGQQWVAYHIHPDTKKPYEWPDEGFDILTTPHDELCEITEEKAVALIQWFEAWCVEQKWARWKSKSTALTTVTARDPDDLLDGSTPLGLPIEEVRSWVERLRNDDDVEYEDNYVLNPEVPNYRNVIFAIWHETDGSEEGREIALEWSEKSNKHEQEVGRFFKMWNSADPEDREYPVTFRYVIKCVIVQEELEKREKRDNYIDSLRSCTDADDLNEIARQISGTKFEGMDFERLAAELKKAYNTITRSTLPIGTARSMIAHKMTEEEIPAWVKPWNYIRHTGRFYNKDTGEEIEYKAFDATFSRYLGGASAADFALNKATIKTYHMQMYVPNEDESFWFEGHECINYFSDRLMPEMPASYSKADLQAISIVERHLKNILPNKRERSLFISFLAYIVKTRKRPNWATVLQGVDGDGKSFFGEMMGAILGSKNVRKLDAQQLEDRYTGWAVGQLLTVVEELRLQGHSRYDILNKIKPYITNNSVNVHPKNVNPYTALNTTAYLCFTNFKDALPLNDNDRRYLVLMSKWQTGDMIREFEDKNPGYFDALFKTLERKGALRKWLMEYELHEDFKPAGRAPLTDAREEMIHMSKSEVEQAFEDILADDEAVNISKELIVSDSLVEALSVHENLRAGAVRHLLTKYGYVHLGRFRIEGNEKQNVWIKNGLQRMSLSGIRKHLSTRERDLNEV